MCSNVIQYENAYNIFYFWFIQVMVFFLPYQRLQKLRIFFFFFGGWGSEYCKWGQAISTNVLESKFHQYFWLSFKKKRLEIFWRKNPQKTNFSFLCLFYFLLYSPSLISPTVNWSNGIHTKSFVRGNWIEAPIKKTLSFPPFPALFNKTFKQDIGQGFWFLNLRKCICLRMSDWLNEQMTKRRKKESEQKSVCVCRGRGYNPPHFHILILYQQICVVMVSGNHCEYMDEWWLLVKSPFTCIS